VFSETKEVGKSPTRRGALFRETRTTLASRSSEPPLRVGSLDLDARRD
jgi:hypothetical protein